jgi:polysaccharide biosynthesis/export protein
VLDAIALAGGFRDFAKQKSIYVLRQNPDGTQTRLPFNYKQVIKGVKPEQNVRLQARDSVVVP